MSKFQRDAGAVFDQADIRAMKRALDCACVALSFAFIRQGGVDLQTKEMLAVYIITDASFGERDPARLSESALRRLPPKVADWDAGEVLEIAAPPSKPNDNGVTDRLRTFAARPLPIRHHFVAR